MSRLAIDPARAVAEAAQFAERMGRAGATLASLELGGEGGAAREARLAIGGTTLWRYRSGGARGTPLLICYALVNRPTMLDLQPDRSLIRGLLRAGLDVWLIDWGSPGPQERDLSLEDYAVRRLGACLDHVREACGGSPPDLLGICQGGTLSLCHAALHPERLRRLVTMVTPVDFHTEDNLLAKWARRLDARRLADAFGNVPGALLNAAFVALAPLRLSVQKYAALADLADDREALANFLRMERWIHDSPDQAGLAFAEFVESFFRDNRLVQGGLEIGGRPVELRAIRCPLLNVYATRDHLVPPSASRALAGRTGSEDYAEYAFDGGHIGIYVSRDAQASVPGAIAGWLARPPRGGPAEGAAPADGGG